MKRIAKALVLGAAAAQCIACGAARAAGEVDSSANLFRYFVSIEGIAGGAEVWPLSGLEGIIEVIEYQDGDDLVLRKRPGGVKVEEVILEARDLAETTLSEWFFRLAAENPDRRTVRIQIQNSLGEPVSIVTLLAGWPSALALRGIESTGSDGPPRLEVTLQADEISVGSGADGVPLPRVVSAGIDPAAGEMVFSFASAPAGRYGIRKYSPQAKTWEKVVTDVAGDAGADETTIRLPLPSDERLGLFQVVLEDVEEP